MDLIISHTNADFDALASMVAASLLYPGAVMSLPGGADRNVREFLSLHGEVIQLAPPQDIPLERVTRLIIVETQHPRRLGSFASLIGRAGVQVILFDHHAPQQPSIIAQEQTLKPYGANTTIMLEELRRRSIAIDPLHATLFALGIYEDTGSLTFTSTCPEDVEMVAWLLRQGANLDLVSTFMNRVLSDRQRAILNELLSNAEDHVIQGIHILVATANAGENVDELALLAHKMREVEQCDALVLLIQMDDNVLLVARSNVDAVNAGELARALGGGGHDRAASATIHRTPLATVKARLLSELQHVVHPRVLALHLMSRPVRTITPHATMDEAARLMLRYGHNGLTVLDNGEVVGIVTRREVDRARHHHLGHAPVRGYMNRRVVTIAPDTPLPEIERLIIEQDISRLPVMQDGQLLGIVTSSDVLRALHGERFDRTRHVLPQSSGPMRNILHLYEERVPEEKRALLQRVVGIANAQGVTIFLVGGAVRDLLLGNHQLDFDILVEGEGIPLAEAVGTVLGARVVAHPKFHTGKVEVAPNEHLDFATARTEFYQHPAALPEAEHSSVREDLYRRDFTINAMAMQLNGEEPGSLLDPFGGSRDLAEGTVRILHNLSFVEDPTRILRAVRFETRFGFRLDERSEELARHAIEMDLLDRVSGDRIRAELLQIFAHPFPETALRRLDELGVLTALEPSWHVLGPAPEYARLEEALHWAEGESAVAAHMPDPAYQRLLLIFTRLGRDEARRLSERLNLRERERNHAIMIPGLLTHLPELARENLKPSELDALLRSLPVSLCLLAMACSDNTSVWERVQTYLQQWRHHSPLVGSEELKELGAPRGPRFGSIMRALRTAQLDQHVRTHAEARTYAKHLIEDDQEK